MILFKGVQRELNKFNYFCSIEKFYIELTIIKIFSIFNMENKKNHFFRYFKKTKIVILLKSFLNIFSENKKFHNLCFTIF